MELSITAASSLAISEGKKIRHRYFVEGEYIFFENGKWYTEDGYELSYSYWLGLGGGFQNGWFVVE